jgi:hypothetical protein
MKYVARLACVCALPIALASAGCVPESHYDEAMAELQAARYHAALRDQQMVALQWKMAAVNQQVMVAQAEQAHAGSTVLYVRKLEELLALNAEMSKRLQSAEAIMTELAQSGQLGGSTRSRLHSTLEELRARRLDSEKRAAAYRELLRVVQGLVDTGQVKAIMKDGHVRFEMPRPLDLGDPWPPGR